MQGLSYALDHDLVELGHDGNVPLLRQVPITTFGGGAFRAGITSLDVSYFVRPTCFENRPTAHLVQFDAATLPLLDAYVPATQAMQSEALMLPVVSTYRPAPHEKHAVEPALL